MENYATNTNGCMPGPAIETSNNVEWYIAIGSAGYFGGTTRVSGYTSSSPFNQTTFNGWKVLECPSEYGSKTAGNGAVPYFRYNGGRSSYAMNASFAPYASAGQMVRNRTRRDWYNGPSYKGSGTYSKTRAPSSAGLVLDITGQSNSHVTSYYDSAVDTLEASNPTTYARVMYAFRHNRTANLLFWDGHVTAMQHKNDSSQNVYNYLYDRTTFPAADFSDTSSGAYRLFPPTGAWTDF